jgi:diguanylate cyclase (GGDEF)-like protein/PAS domain S-box-containing protein
MNQGDQHPPASDGPPADGATPDADDERALLHALLESSRDITAVVDAEGRITWVSGNVEEMLGYTPDELVGTMAFDLIDPEHLHEAVERFAEIVARTVTPAPLILRVRHRSGATVPIEALGTALSGDGDTSRVMVNLRDARSRLEADRALQASEARLRTVVNSSYDVVAVVDATGTITWVTDNSVRLLGWTPDEVIGRSGFDLVHPDDRPPMLDELTAFASGAGVPNPTVIRMLHRDGTWHHVELVGTDLLDNPDIAGIAINLRGVDERVAAERTLHRLTDIFELTSDVVGIAELTGHSVYLNRAGREFFAIPEGVEPRPETFRTRFTGPSLERLIEEVTPELTEGVIWTGELEVIRADGTIVPMHTQVIAHAGASGDIEFLSGVMRDISDQKAHERQLEHDATHDPLTGLPNRTLLLDRLELAARRAQRRGGDIGVLFCDLDRFKVVNDRLGHEAGDQLLHDIALRLASHLRPGDTVGRYGGDEFVILCEDLEQPTDAETVAARMVAALDEPFRVAGHEILVGLSIGIAVTHDGSETGDDLIRRADEAMYQAKQRDRTGSH